MKKALLGLGLLLLVALAILFLVGPAATESAFNRVVPQRGAPPSEKARALHRQLLIADLHADSLLWGRDLLERGTRGHADIPRLIEGNVAVQAFTVVTKTPRGLNIERNEATSDTVIWLVLAERWPPRAWTQLTERALYQARRLERMAAKSSGKLVLLRTAADLSDYLERRRRNPAMVAGVLGIEGAHALDGDVKNLDRLFDAGFRMMSPTHFFDNEFAGASAGLDKGGLTKLGNEMVRRMEAKRMLVDLAHASPQTIIDVLAMATRPVVVSHTGVQGTCSNRRNLSDAEVRGIARTGGVIGIGFWPTAACGSDARAVARAMRYAANLVGVEHVALGSDFDGAVTMPFDAAGLVALTDALLAEGFTEAEIAAMMGGNTLRLLRENLP